MSCNLFLIVVKSTLKHQNPSSQHMLRASHTFSVFVRCRILPVRALQKPISRQASSLTISRLIRAPQARFISQTVLAHDQALSLRKIASISKRFASLLSSVLPTSEEDAEQIENELRKRASTRDPQAIFELSTFLLGNNLEEEALELCMQASQKGHDEATVCASWCYLAGVGTQPDSERALAMIDPLLKRGHAGAHLMLGTSYIVGEGIQIDTERGLSLLRAAADSGDAESQFQFGKFYYLKIDEYNSNKKLSLSRDFIVRLSDAMESQSPTPSVPYEAAEPCDEEKSLCFRYLKLAADSNHPFANLHLGHCYELGIGVPVDVALAVQLYLKSAELGVAQALHELGQCYRDGNGVEKDDEKAFQFFLQACTAGDEHSFSELAECYMSGKGTAVDMSAAISWLQKGSDSGDTVSQYNLARLFETGAEGVAPNTKRAYELYSLAAERNDPDALYRLSVCLFHGRGVYNNISDAMRRVSKAAMQGNALALHALGYLFENGLHVGENKEAANTFYELAESLGVPRNSTPFT